MKIEKNVSLKPYNSWAVGGEADYFVQPKNVSELKQALLWAKEKNENLTLLGRGSNVLISDQGVQGLVVSLNHWTGLNVIEEKKWIKIEAEAGVLKSELFKVFYKLKLSPALFLVGIPGNVAGGVVMNAGIREKVFPHQFNQIVSWIEILDFKKKEEEKNSTSSFHVKDDFDSPFCLRRVESSQMKWSYRGSEGWQPGIILKVGFSWPNVKEPALWEKIKKHSKKRIKTQPLQFLSCGSVFKNPKFDSSGALIEKAGLKGFFVRGAQVSKKHANFILNWNQQAKAQDIHELISVIQEKVKEKTGIYLQTEVRYIGRWQ